MWIKEVGIGEAVQNDLYADSARLKTIHLVTNVTTELKKVT